MWLPKTEAEIVNVINSGALEESDSFDAKEELSKNQEIAKDVAAMANNGGVILYGIGEDERGRVTRLTPILLQGLAERVDAIVRSSIAEPPVIHVSTIPTETDPNVGYLVVFVPPSERAPHMVVVKGDHRFYGRTATGNYPLSEGEVARLYARRQQIEVNREKLIELEIAASPLEPDENYVYLFLFARPVFAKEGFFDSLLNDEAGLQKVFGDLVREVSKGDVFPQNFQPDFTPPPSWKRRTEGLCGAMGYPSGDKTEIPKRTLNLQVDFDGTGHLFCGRAGDRYSPEEFSVFPEIIAGLTVRFMNFMGKLYERSAYIGMVDFGLALTGLKGSVPFTNNFRLHYSRVPYDRSEYKKTGRFSAIQLLEDPISPSKYLVMPFVNAISQGWIDPFTFPRS